MALGVLAVGSHGVPGKWMPTALYVHTSTLVHLPKELVTIYEKGLKVIREDAQLDGRGASIIKFHRDTPRVSFMWLRQDFDSVGHPELVLSLLVDVQTGALSSRSYMTANNLPVIHRKELMVDVSYPLWDVFHRLTVAEEMAGLLNNPPGFRQQWDALLARRGFRVIGNKLFKVR